MKMTLAILFFLYLISSCEKDLFSHEELTLNKRPYAGSQLKIDGYYFKKPINNNIYRIYFLYRDGTLLWGGDVYEDDLLEQEQKFLDGDYAVSKRDHELYWGVFHIDSNAIKIEKWHPSSKGGLPVYLHSGEILNDTTFVLTKSVHSKTGKERDINRVYHFKKFSPKPDSTNCVLE